MSKDDRKIKKAYEAVKKKKFDKAKRKLSNVSESTASRRVEAFIRREEQKAKPSPTAKVRTSKPLYPTEFS